MVDLRVIGSLLKWGGGGGSQGAAETVEQGHYHNSEGVGMKEDFFLIFRNFSTLHGRNVEGKRNRPDGGRFRPLSGAMEWEAPDGWKDSGSQVARR